MSSVEVLNHIGGTWRRPTGASSASVTNPATAEEIASVSFSPGADVDAAAEAGHAAFQGWRRTPATDRIQYLFKLKDLLEHNFEDLARSITLECGKTLGESQGELRRGIENVEVACGIPIMLQGSSSVDIASGIDEFMIRQPVGVVAAITPFNFPAMIPLWFTPYAIACGNCIILKPSERVPLTLQKIVRLIEQTGIPKGVVQLVNGARETTEAVIDHPLIRAISFVGSTAVARSVYSRSTSHGKRAQCQGGAKNPVIILPDADMESACRIVGDSAFGCAGQRCLAGSMAITIGKARGPFTEAISDLARSRRIGFGLDEDVEMGPVITAQSQDRIRGLIQKGIEGGAQATVDGRNRIVKDHPNGFFVGPTILDGIDPNGEIASTEIFGPVLSMLHFDDVDGAIDFVNRGTYGNMACLFTSSGAAARKFRYEVDAGNIGINLGVAAPMAFFPFSGWKDSFFGDLHAQGTDAIDFYTQKKVVVERWPKDWSRKF